MFEIGDCVVFSLDGARGIVLAVEDASCHVLWEDQFTSWEKAALLRKDDRLTQKQRLHPTE